MNLFAWLRPTAPDLADNLRQRLAALPAPAPLGVCTLREQRWVVLDLETSGLNLNRDQVLSIGAVAIEDGAIDMGRPFERTLYRPGQKTNASVLIHGLGPSALAAGCDPAEALLDLMTFIGDSPVLAFHAPFDRHMLARALKDSLGLRLQHGFLDVAELAPMLNPDTVLREAGLDDWVARFGLEVQARHHASADAQVTAELALILFSQARRQQLDSPLQLEQGLRQWRRRKVQ
ncbi:3'-5' exonuclease, partial [Pseudomonas sp. GD03867]